MIKRQTTINRIFKVSGIGLHSGQQVTLEFLPRREFGIAFVYKNQLIPARYDMVGDTRLSTQTDLANGFNLFLKHKRTGIDNCKGVFNIRNPFFLFSHRCAKFN